MSLRIVSLDERRGGHTPRVFHESAMLVTTSGAIADRNLHSPGRRRGATQAGWPSAAAAHAQAPDAELAVEAPAAMAVPALPALALQAELLRRRRHPVRSMALQPRWVRPLQPRCWRPAELPVRFGLRAAVGQCGSARRAPSSSR